MRLHSIVLTGILVLFLPSAAAFGYAQGTMEQTVLPGDEVHFTVYVLGDDLPVKVTTIDAPESWDVNVDPTYVNGTGTGDHRYIETPDGYQKLIPVTLTASVPLHADPGDYPLTVRLVSASADTGLDGSGVAVRHRESLTYTVYVSDDGAQAPDATAPDEEQDSTGSADALPDTGRSGIVVTGDSPDSQAETTDTGIQGQLVVDRVTNPVVLFVLFQIGWGIALGYVLKRRDYI